MFYVLCSMFLGEVWAATKAGINIGDHYNEFGTAAGAVGSGGWVYTMMCPGNKEQLKEMIANTSVNLAVRGHYPGQVLDGQTARAWAVTLYDVYSELANEGRSAGKVYFMPVNEPNGLQDAMSPSAVAAYTDALQLELDSAGLRGAAVVLLAPMLDVFYLYDQTNNNPGSGYPSQLGGSSYFSQFDGIPMNLYGQYRPDGTIDNGAPEIKRGRGYPQFMQQYYGVDKPVYALETGVGIVGMSPFIRYGDAQPQMVDYFGNQVGGLWAGDGGFRAFSVFSYDPHGNQAPWIYGADAVLRAMKAIGGGGGAQTATFTAGAGQGWRETVGLDADDFRSCGGGAAVGLPQTRPEMCVPYLRDELAACLPGKEFTVAGSPVLIPPLPAGLKWPVNWSGMFEIEDKSMSLPFAGVLADYFEGPFYNPQRLFELCGVGPYGPECYGPLSKLTPQELQNELKREFIDKVEKGELSDFLIGGKGVKGLKGFNYQGCQGRSWVSGMNECQAWARVPLLPRNDSFGEAEFKMQYSDANPGDDHRTGYIEDKKMVDLAVPHLARLAGAVDLLFKILVPQSSTLAEPDLSCSELRAPEAGAEAMCVVADANGRVDVSFEATDRYENPIPPLPDLPSFKTETPQRQVELSIKLPFIKEIWQKSAGQLGFISGIFKNKASEEAVDLPFKPVGTTSTVEVRVAGVSATNVPAEVKLPFLGGIMNAKEWLDKLLYPRE